MEIKLLEVDELPALYAILSKPDISKNLTVNPYKVTEKNIGQFLLSTEQDTSAEAFAIYVSGVLVGCITLNNISLLKHSACIGALIIDDESQSDGLLNVGMKATKWAIDYALRTLRLNRIYAHTWSDNVKMEAMYKRLHAVYEGTEREHAWKEDQYVDRKRWSILRREWIGGENG